MVSFKSSLLSMMLKMVVVVVKEEEEEEKDIEREGRRFEYIKQAKQSKQ